MFARFPTLLTVFPRFYTDAWLHVFPPFSPSVRFPALNSDSVCMFPRPFQRCLFPRSLHWYMALLLFTSCVVFFCLINYSYVDVSKIFSAAEIVLSHMTALMFSQLDNHGNHMLLTDESPINVPGIAAAHVIKRYTAQAADEISLEV